MPKEEAMMVIVTATVAAIATEEVAKEEVMTLRVNVLIQQVDSYKCHSSHAAEKKRNQTGVTGMETALKPLESKMAQMIGTT